MAARDHLNQNQVIKALDQSLEDSVSEQPANFAEPPWHLLHHFIPEEERGGWMYMGEGKRSNPTDFFGRPYPKTHHEFKHGISRYTIGIADPDLSYELTPRIVKGDPDIHYERLKEMDESPTTPYDDTYIAERSKRLSDIGWNTIIGKAE